MKSQENCLPYSLTSARVAGVPRHQGDVSHYWVRLVFYPSTVLLASVEIK